MHDVAGPTHDGAGPLAKVMMLEALIRAECGDVANARETMRALLPIAEQLGQSFELGRVRFNLAECNLRLGDLDAAMNEARAAIETFQALGNVVEETRREWTIAMIGLARGERDAIDRSAPLRTAKRLPARSATSGDAATTSRGADCMSFRYRLRLFSSRLHLFSVVIAPFFVVIASLFGSDCAFFRRDCICFRW